MIRKFLQALSIALSFTRIAAAADSAAPPPQPKEILSGDFVERGPIPRGTPRDLAMVELINDSGLPIDAALGQGTTSLRPEDRMILRTEPGDVPFRVVVPGHPEQRLEATLHFERGMRYAIVLALAEAGEGDDPSRPAEVAGTAPDGAATPQAAAATGAAPAPQPGKRAMATRPEESKSRKGGKVDIGRKRPEDRR